MIQLVLDEMEEGEICEEAIAMETGATVYHSRACRGIPVHRIANKNFGQMTLILNTVSRTFLEQ